MTIPSPLQKSLEQYELPCSHQHEDVQREGAASGKYQAQLLSEFLPWGESGCTVLATTGVVELEYAAIQKSKAIFDASCRGTIAITGADRLECINRLSTQQLLEMKTGESCLTFLISRKGGIIADAIIHLLHNKILVDVDITVVESVCDHINSYIVMEDVEVENKTDSIHWLWCFCSALDQSFEEKNSFTLPFELLGLNGKAICTSSGQVVEIWNKFVQQGAMPVGWYVINMARVEQGAPIFMIDFDSNNLPHETNLTQSRVSFTKGCYLGQEIVARMESLGQPKQRIMQLRMDSDDLPIAGTQLWKDKTGAGTPIGVVTSSAISPLRGGVPAAIAMIGKNYAKSNTKTFMFVGSEIVSADISELQTNEESP